MYICEYFVVTTKVKQPLIIQLRKKRVIDLCRTLCAISQQQLGCHAKPADYKL